MLVVQASVMGKGGEVFILRMGAPIKIVEMAKDLIALHGMSLEEVPIKITGLRDGEKLHEDLVVEGESVEDSSHGYILTARPQLPDKWDADSILAEFRNLGGRGDRVGIRSLLNQIIPDAQLDES
jgi:FlaA1/EpsC-like NDP-sugar epimerase